MDNQTKDLEFSKLPLKKLKKKLRNLIDGVNREQNFKNKLLE